MQIRFYSKSPQFGWLSNFSQHAFTLDGVRWASVEHYYQAQKYAGTETADRIRKAESAVVARKLGQNRSLTPRDDWDTVKVDIMRRAVRAKFEQNRQLREQLLETGDNELVHESKSDLFWGLNLDGAGDNRLGLILMETRSQLRGQDEP